MFCIDNKDYTGALMLLRGVPASGKSTWVEESGLPESYVVSSDAIRIELNGVRVGDDGREYIPQDNPGRVWNEVYDRIERLCADGAPVVILDATNIKYRDMVGYIDYLDHYGYKGYVVDFTDVPLAEALRRNAQREQYKQVPVDVIERMYNQLDCNGVPDCFEIVSREVGLRIARELVS